MLARAQTSTGDNLDAITTIGRALEPAGLPAVWRARMLALLSMLQRSGNGDPSAITHSLADLWLIGSVRRDFAAAIDYLDRALRVLGDDAASADLRSYVLTVRVFALQNLERWQDAELALRQAREFTKRTGTPDGAT